MTKLKIPSMLSYSRSINPTDARLFAIREGSDIEKPVLVTERGARAPMSNYSETKKVDKNPARSNPKVGDVAFLPVDTDTLVIKYSLTFTGKSLAPHSCGQDSQDVRHALGALTEAFKARGGYEVLAKKYLGQILDGSCAWRNLESCEEVVVRAMTRKTGVVATTDTATGETTLDDTEAYAELVGQIATALSSPRGLVRVNVEMHLPMADLAEVYPSQSFKDGASGRLLSSILIETNQGIQRQAMIHNQKIGNAVRRIDDWYGHDVEPLAVEPFGIDRTLDQAVRVTLKRDFYTLLQKKVLEFVQTVGACKSASEIPDDVYYVVACLIRGGVFSGKEG